MQQRQQVVAGNSFANVVKFGLRPRFLIVPADESDKDGRDTAPPELKPWHALPYNFLVSVCRYLQDRDRYQMACVCRAWREASQNPSLWRTHIFYLYCRHEVPQGLVWLSARAKFLQNATIMCFGNFDRRREEFLRALQPADLLNLDINGAAYWWSAAAGSATCGRVVARIVRLLKTQRRLQGFQMRQAMLPFTTGMGVLAALLVASGHTLTRMGLEDFFGDQISLNLPIMPDRFTNLVCQFSQLTELTINYEYLTDGLLRWLGRDGEDRTIQLNIVSWLTSAHRPGVSKEAWAHLAASTRDVRIYLILQNIRSISEVRYSILRPEIPMNRLDLVGIAALGHDDNAAMVDLLRHIADSYSRTLAGLRLWSDNFMCTEIETSVLDLLRKSPKLTYLDLHMDVRCQMLAVLCDMQRNQAIKLETLRLARSLTNFFEFEQFKAQVRACYPILKELGLDFHVRAESAPDHSARNEYVFIIADNAGIMDSEDESYLASFTTASSLASTAPKTTTDNHNNSNVRPDVHNSSSGDSRRRRRHRRRARHSRATLTTGSGNNGSQFEWRLYRLRRQLRSRSRRFRDLH